MINPELSRDREGVTIALWAAESDKRQRAKRGLASNFAAPNLEKRQHGHREIRCLSPVCPSCTLTLNGAITI